MALWNLTSEIATSQLRIQRIHGSLFYSFNRRFIRVAQLPDELEKLLQHHNLGVRGALHARSLFAQNVC